MTEIVIEGFPRCGNTFFTIYFMEANPQVPSGNIAHHIHRMYQIRKALYLGVPTIILLREPASCISSLLIRLAKAKGAEARLLRRYIAFYTFIERHKSRFLIADFNVAVNEPDRVLMRFNEIYGTNYNHPPMCSTLRDSIFSRIDRYNALDKGDEIRSLARPTEARKRYTLKETKLLQKARTLYEGLLETAIVGNNSR